MSGGTYADRFASLKLEDPGVFPVRVIDIQATLEGSSLTGGVVFTEPKDWQFHTISHTWSLHIRRLSEEIGRRVASVPTFQCSYNEAFLHAMLHHQPGYSHLLEFLAMIRADGADRVWCDALCINQLDDDEKSHEILHMGAFYFHSLGCYTVAHGFGGGFSLTVNDHVQLDDGDDEDRASSACMPRWFSRVWTLQEWWLPRRLTFVVELDRSLVHRLVKEVREWHEFGECECKGTCMSDVWHWGSRDRHSPTPTAGMRGTAAVEDVDDEEEFWKVLQRSGYKCLHGRFQEFTNPQFSTNRDRKSLYWVDRVPYMLLIQSMESKSERMYEFLTEFTELWDGGHPGIVGAISSRNCSAGHDEDRVLSVLALLGIEGKLQQLRTGQSLDQQIMQMADAMAIWNLQGLIRLCAAFFKPYDSPLRLSWAPHFRARRAGSRAELEAEKYNVQKSFQHAVGRVSVCAARGLSMACHMLKGKLIPYREHAKECTAGSACCYTCEIKPASWRTMFALQIASCAGHVYAFSCVKNCNERLELITGDVFKRSTHQFYSSYYLQGRMLFDIDLPSSKIELNVWLLLLGSYEEKRQYAVEEAEARTVLVLMVCVGTRDNFHKVGMLHVLPTYSAHYKKHARSGTLHLDLFEKAYCTIGAFSKADWNKWTLEQLNMSRLWNYT